MSPPSHLLHHHRGSEAVCSTDHNAESRPGVAAGACLQPLELLFLLLRGRLFRSLVLDLLGDRGVAVRGVLPGGFSGLLSRRRPWHRVDLRHHLSLCRKVVVAKGVVG